MYMDKPGLQKLIGNSVRHYRMERKMTQDALANIVNVNPSAITRIESGSRMMSVPTLKAVADALGVSCDALLSKQDDSSSHKTNIEHMLSTQSDKSLSHLEKVIHSILTEYGEEES